MTMSWYKVIYAEKRSCENKEKRLLSTKQGKRLCEETRTVNNLLSDSTQNYEKTDFSCLSHLVYGVLCCGSPSKLKQSVTERVISGRLRRSSVSPKRRKDLGLSRRKTQTFSYIALFYSI